jgi:hypothetical protein
VLYFGKIGVDAMTRDQIVKVSQKAARQVADPKSGKPVSKKHIERAAELKRLRAAKDAAPYEERMRA